MGRGARLYGSTVGKKIVMATTGILLFGFVVVHLLGNLKLYQGQEKYDAYAAFLREVGSPVFGHGQLLWVGRLVLLAAVALHLDAALRLTSLSRRAREAPYHAHVDLSFHYASRTMRWGGVIIAAFVVYHLLHLTFGTLHGDFRADSPYRNVVTGLAAWPVALAYVGAMLPLGLHLYHGLWSATQTLALRNPRIQRLRRPAAALIAWLIVLGNVSLPVSVLAGVVR
jgi:succinate dehydrogenase / fumarate reductase cytochrome b subunit